MTSEAVLSGAVLLAQELVRCPSVTPETSDLFDLLEARLKGAGFECWRLPFGAETDAPGTSVKN